MASITDVVSTIQNGVTSFNNLTTQMKGSFNNISSQLTTLQSSGVKSIAGNTGAFTLSNGLTNVGNDIQIAAGAWTVFTPTVTPSAGAFTTVSASGGFYTIGKLVHFSVTITITAIGTASGVMSIPLPVGTAKRAASVIATETATVGTSGYGRIAATGANINSISKYDNTSYIANGAVITLTGIYEQT